jgi:hypothetical protein
VPRARPTRWTAALAALVAALAAAPARAHGASGSGEVEAAALPAWTVWVAGGLVVLVSFALMALVRTREREPQPVDGVPVDGGQVTGLPRGLVGALRVGGLLLLALVVASALVPWNPGPGARRIVWMGLWAGLPIAGYLVGNVWALVSPFRALAGAAERLRGDQPPLSYPDGLGAWPSLAALAALVGLEAVAPSATGLGQAAIVYTTVTVVGMATFGSRTWLARAEVFDRAFAWWSLAAPGRLTEAGWRWRAPGHALADARAVGLGDAAFLVGLLFAAKAESVQATGAAGTLVDALGPAPGGALAAVGGLAVFALLFAGLVEGVSRATRTLAARADLAAVLAVPLVPIAVGYHLAHNLPHVVDTLPLLVEALASPLAVVPTAEPLGLAAWGQAVTGVQMGLVVLGHVAGVWAGHRRLLGAFPSRVQAAKAELVLTAAMVAYTLVSLWTVHAAAGGMP